MGTERVVIALNAVDVLVEACQFGADSVHRESIGGKVDKAWVFWEGKEWSSGVESNVLGPAGEIGRIGLGEVVIDGIEVEIPSIASVCRFNEGIEEEGSPLGAEDVIFEVKVDGVVPSLHIQSLEVLQIFPDFSVGLVVVLVHGGGVESEVACNFIEVVACSCECYFSSNAVSSEGGHGDLVLVHEPGDII